ncbi:MAG: bifunctional folylpolyglutamate synthase/dihydrofolate synthase [Desulforudis sp.]|jgi:dihydrofolate synthase/folylpolyglutamate synthase|nr:MAG: bifunctional folylpolyglutamate synthase/dihydrofolate synthase [Desulforudis sp.]
MYYDAALEYLRSIAAAGSRLGLNRVLRLLGRLDNPHHGLPCVHVGGTNGKGSVTAMLTAILVAAGYRVGTFTSPHLVDYIERFCLDGKPVEPERLAGLITALQPVLDDAAEDERLTEFEIHTVLALRLFREEQVDIAILEVGLGGRLDATNVVTPLVSVITNVTYDHMDYLGETLEAIAAEKAGIIKPGVPVVTAAEGPALGVIEEVCQVGGSRLIWVGRDVRWEAFPAGIEGQAVSVYGIGPAYRNLRIPMLGVHQAVNTACAVTTVNLLNDRGFPLVESAIREGLAEVRWPGRFEILERDGVTVVLDAAHNAAAAAALGGTLRQVFPQNPVTMVLGVLADKDRERVVAELVPLAAHVVVTRPPTARAGEWRDVAVFAREYGPAVYEIEDYREALAKGLSLALEIGHHSERVPGVLLITGSIYLLGALRVKLKNLKN